MGGEVIVMIVPLYISFVVLHSNIQWGMKMTLPSFTSATRSALPAMCAMPARTHCSSLAPTAQRSGQRRPITASLRATSALETMSLS